MARRDPTLLSEDLRQRADQPAGPRRGAADPALVVAAKAGDLTRRNTEKGTAGRKAADRAFYESSLAKRPGQTARQARGHGVGTATQGYLNQAGERVDLQGSRAEIRRIARYDAYVSNLAQGKITPKEFEKRVGSWKPINGEQFLSDPAAVLAKLEELRAADETLWNEDVESP